MGLFKSGKSKADDLLSILIPSLEWQMREELKQRLTAQMEDVVHEVAAQVIGYGYDDAIKELTVKVRAPQRPWVGLTESEVFEFLSCGVNGREDINNIEELLRSKNSAL
jgi:hypothetical protein